MVVLILPAQPPHTPWALPAGGGSPRQGLCPPPPPRPSPSLVLTLSEVVMTSMPSPSSCVKNCDATLRRVMLSPLLPAMAAAQYALEKKKMDDLPLTTHKGSTLLPSPLGSPKPLPVSGSVSDCKCT